MASQVCVLLLVCMRRISPSNNAILQCNTYSKTCCCCCVKDIWSFDPQSQSLLCWWRCICGVKGQTSLENPTRKDTVGSMTMDEEGNCETYEQTDETKKGE